MVELNLDFSKYEAMDKAVEAPLAEKVEGQVVDAVVDAVSTEAEKVETVAAEGEAEVAKEEEKKEEPKKTDRQTAAFAELAKREHRLTLEQKAFKEQKEQYNTFIKEQDDLKEDPLSYVMRKTGKTFDDLVTSHLDKLDNKPEDKVKKLEDRISAFEKQKKEDEDKFFKAQESARWNSHIQAVSKYVETNKDEYEVINSYPTRALEVYTDVLNQARQYAGRELEEAEVIQVIKRTENVLAAEVKPLIERLGNSKKFVKPAEPTETVKKTEPEKKINTLSNELTQSSPKIQQTGRVALEDKIKQVASKYDS